MYASPAGKCGQSGRARAQVQAGRQAGGQASKQPSIRVTSGSKRDAGGGQAGCRMLVVMRSLLSERPRTIGNVGIYLNLKYVRTGENKTEGGHRVTMTVAGSFDTNIACGGELPCISLSGVTDSLSLGSLLMAAAGGVREVEEREGEEERKKRVRADDRCVPNLPIATNQIESITHSESELLLVKTVRGTY